MFLTGPEVISGKIKLLTIPTQISIYRLAIMNSFWCIVLFFFCFPFVSAKSKNEQTVHFFILLAMENQDQRTLTWPVTRSPGAYVVTTSGPHGDKAAATGTMDISQVGGHSSAAHAEMIFPQIYYQCRAERDATFTNKATELGNGPTFGYEVGGETARIGSFEQNSKGMDSCFYGSRVNKGTTAVNQNICLSFDPLSMPPGFVVSDQNYVANLSGGAGAESCIGVIRLESAGLDELTDFVCELFEQRRLGLGTVLCIGSGTHLHRTGPTIYAQD